MEEKSKILILSSAYLPHIGGSELAIKNITDRLPDFDFDIITARLDKSTPKHEKLGNVSVFRVGGALSPIGFLLPKTFLPLTAFWEARKLIKNNRYIAVHAFQASGAAGAGWLLKYYYPELPFIITLQEGKNLKGQGPIVNFFRGLIIKKADFATAISNYLKDYILRIDKELKVEIIPNGVDFNDFSKKFSYGELTDMDNRLGIKPDDKVIISASRFVPKNGLDLLVKAVAELNKDRQFSYKLILAGDGKQKEELKKLAEELKIKDKIIFAGVVAQNDLPLYLKISDVFVRPSLSEGLGIAFLEAMAAGVPIIGTRVGGIPDFLEDRRTGLFCTLEPKDIAFKIRIVLENDKLREEMINNAAALVREKYDWDNIAKDFRKLYSRFL